MDPVWLDRTWTEFSIHFLKNLLIISFVEYGAGRETLKLGWLSISNDNHLFVIVNVLAVSVIESKGSR